MAVCCYKCGAMPNHPNKALDVLKLIQCSDCGTIACVNHRDGIIGGKCAKCGSSRSTVVAFRKGGQQGKDQANAAVGGTGGGGSSAGGGDVGISTGQLQNMQAQRTQAMADGQARLTAQQAQVAEENLSAEERKRREELEEELGKLFGDSDFVKSAGAEEMISNISAKLPDGISLADLQRTLSDEKDKDEKSSDFKAATTMLSAAVNQADIAEQIKGLMKDKNFNSGSGSLNYGSGSSLKGVSVKTMVSTEKVLDNSKSLIKVSNSKITTNKITLLDSFNVKSNYRISLDDAIEMKKQSCDEISEFLIKEFDITDTKLDLTLKVNKFIPLDNIDHLLNLYAEDLKKENISIITGVLVQKLTFDSMSYVEQFSHILPQKSYISGIYASFANNPEYSYEEQKELNLQLIDMAQENGKMVYLGLDNSSISCWQEIFDEYELSEIPFVYTEVIKDDETFEFIKQNKIKILIRPDVNFQYYADILKDYKNFCFGSAFERITQSNQEKVANSSLLGNILKNMYKINPELIDDLLNLED